MRTLSVWRVFWQLLKTDLITLHHGLLDNMINAAIWAGTLPIVTTYFLTAPTLSTHFGLFQAIGSIVGIAGYNLFTRVSEFLGDLDGDCFFMYHISLPLPGILLCFKMVVISAIHGLFLGFFALLVTKILLWHTFVLKVAYLPKLIIGLLVINIFFACFMLMIMGFTKNLPAFRHVWVRMLYPLWFLGGFQFTWKSLYAKNNILAYFALCNPYLHAQEGLRSAIIGSGEYLPFWVCMFVLSCLAFICFISGFFLFQRRFDMIPLLR